MGCFTDVTLNNLKAVSLRMSLLWIPKAAHMSEASHHVEMEKTAAKSHLSAPSSHRRQNEADAGYGPRMGKSWDHRLFTCLVTSPERR